MRESYRKAVSIIHQHNGLLHSRQAQQLGIDPKTISEMHQAGILDRIGRGLYRLTDLPPLDYPDLVQIVLRVPSAVICLITALAFHNLTVEVPKQIYIALPQSTKRPRVKYPPLAVFWLSGKAYEVGVEKHLLDGIEVPIYSKAKTVTDCFKFRNKIGKDIALAALKKYVYLPGLNVDELLRYARINRVERVMMPYLEAIL